MSDERYGERKTTVLSEEERCNFQGITINENGEETIIEEGITTEQQQGNPFGSDQFKVYTFSTLSWKWKLGLAVLLGLGVAALFFFGSFLFIGFLVFAAIWICISFIKSLFL